MYPLLCTLFEKRAVTKWPELSDKSRYVRSKSPSNFNGFLPGFDKLQKIYERPSQQTHRQCPEGLPPWLHP